MTLDLQVTPRQRAFLEADADEVLFGGAAGGGKSYGQLIDALLYALKYPRSKQLILRRSFPELERSLIMQHLSFYPRQLYRYNMSGHRGVFTNGSMLEFGYLESEADVYRYQGAEYDMIRFDELTQIPEWMYLYLISRLRGANDYPKQIKSTANPGGIGHAFVKKRFIEGHVPNQTFERVENGRRQRLVFLPSLAQDNHFLLGHDPEYVQRLELLPEKERRALLLGDWNIFDGQVFAEWRDDPEHYYDRRWTHVIEPFEVPAHWLVWRGYDFGYAKPFSVGWYTADSDGKIYRIRELYGCKRKPDGSCVPNEGVMEDPVRQAAMIREVEATDPLLRGRRIAGIADPAIFDESRGESIAQMMGRHPNFVHWRPANNNRLAGKMQLHYRLAFDRGGECMFQVFNTCREFIRTIPALVYDERHVEDVDTRQEDHIYDECRYVLMERPISPRKSEPLPPIGDDPLNMQRDARRERAQIFRF